MIDESLDRDESSCESASLQSIAEDTFEERVRAVIVGESIRSFAKRADIPASTMKSMLTGTKPTVDNLAAVARTGGVTIDWLVTGEPAILRDYEIQFAIDESKMAALRSAEAAATSIEEITEVKRRIDDLQKYLAASHEFIALTRNLIERRGEGAAKRQRLMSAPPQDAAPDVSGTADIAPQEGNPLPRDEQADATLPAEEPPARTPRRWALWGNATPSRPLVAPHSEVAEHLAISPDPQSTYDLPGLSAEPCDVARHLQGADDLYGRAAEQVEALYRSLGYGANIRTITNEAVRIARTIEAAGGTPDQQEFALKVAVDQLRVDMLRSLKDPLDPVARKSRA